MIRKIAVLAVLCALTLACDPLARSEMTLTFDDTGESVNIDVVSDDNHLKTYHAADRDHIGEDVLAGRDEWSLRFARTDPQDERVVLNRSKGAITRIENQASVDIAQLQKFFSQDGVTVQVTRGDGWVELTMYPGRSLRADRKQEATMKRELDAFSHLAVAYFDSLRDLYRYLDANDVRAEEMLYAVCLDEKDEAPKLSEKEKSLVEQVRKTAIALVENAEKDNKELGRLADLMFNPLPAVVDVRVPGEPLVVEGFQRLESGMLRASTDKPEEVLQHLEGRWVSPDLFAALERRGKDLTTRQFAAELAKEPRHAAPVVVASDIVEAVVAGMQPAPRYRVRWATKIARDEKSASR